MTRLPSRNWGSPISRVLATGLSCLVAATAMAEPTVERVAPAGPFVVGKPFTFECVIRWADGDGPWLVQPAEFSQPAWANLEAVKSTASKENSENLLVQLFSVEPLEAGGHELPEITFHYSSYEAFQPAETQRPQSPNAPTTLNALRVPPFPVEVKPHTTPNWVSAGLPLIILALAVAALAWYVVHRRRLRQTAPVQPETAAGTEWLADVQRRRMEGDTYGFYRRLAEVATDPALREQFGKTAEAVGYKGEHIGPDQLDQDLRALQRSLRQGEGRNDS